MKRVASAVGEGSIQVDGTGSIDRMPATVLRVPAAGEVSKRAAMPHDQNQPRSL